MEPVRREMPRPFTRGLWPSRRNLLELSQKLYLPSGVLAPLEALGLTGLSAPSGEVSLVIRVDRRSR